MNEINHLPARMKINLKIWLISSLVLIVGTSFILLYSAQILEKKACFWEEKAKKIRQKTRILQENHQEIQQYGQKQESYQKRLKKLQKQGQNPVAYLAILANHIPTDTRLESFIFEQEKPLIIQARSKTSLSVRQFINRLTQAGSKRVKIQDYRTDSQNGKESIVFSLNIL
ncbi:MAG: hypothetical protein WA432_01430 [Candidatus Babeliaceae bacterium]